MKPRESFEFEMEALARDFGKETADRTYLVLIEAVRWLSNHGHGNLTLSAINHRFGQKIHGDTIISVENGERLSPQT